MADLPMSACGSDVLSQQQICQTAQLHLEARRLPLGIALRYLWDLITGCPSEFC